MHWIPLMRVFNLVRKVLLQIAKGNCVHAINKDYWIRNTRMHSSRMRTARSLTVSRCILRMPPWGKTTHTLRQKPCMPPGKNHACPPAKTTHAPPPAKTMHAPLGKNHACPPAKTMHAPLAKTMHTPDKNHSPLAKTTHAPLPPSNHACPPMSNHACPPPSNHARPPVNRITDACENIAFANYVCGR